MHSSWLSSACLPNKLHSILIPFPPAAAVQAPSPTPLINRYGYVRLNALTWDFCPVRAPYRKGEPKPFPPHLTRHQSRSGSPWMFLVSSAHAHGREPRIYLQDPVPYIRTRTSIGTKSMEDARASTTSTSITTTPAPVSSLASPLTLA